MQRDRTDYLAAELERVVTELRDGEARLHGYRIERDPSERERGAIAYTGGWLAFELEHPEGWFEPETGSVTGRIRSRSGTRRRRRRLSRA